MTIGAVKSIRIVLADLNEMMPCFWYTPSILEKNLVLSVAVYGEPVSFVKIGAVNAIPYRT
jgi:hypothetical protein